MLRRLPPATIAVAAFFGLVAFARAAIPLIDGDVWWHIRAGREILASGAIPRTDTWSLVTPGAAWTSQDWLSNVVLAALDGLGPVGHTMASLLYSALVVIALVLLWLALSVRGSTGWLGRIVWLATGLTVAGPTLGVRVQVVDLLFAAATLLVLWHYLAHRRRRWLIALPLLAMAWANLHAGWVVLFLLGGAVLAGEFLDALAGRRLPGQAPPLAGRDAGWLLAAGLASLAAVALNPNGAALYAYPLTTSLIAAHRDYLAEWSPPDIALLPGQLLAGFLVLGVLPALALGARRARCGDLLVLLGLTLMAVSAARFLLLIPLAAAVSSLLLDPILAESRFGRRLARPLRSLARPARTAGLGLLNALLCAAVLAAGALVAAARVSPAAQARSIAEHMPVAAVDWLLDHPSGRRPFNTYSWGGYLGYRRPELPVFIDGRSDVYGDAPIRAYADAVQLNVDPATLLDGYGIDHVLFNTGTPLARWLDARSEWQRVYRDPLATIWVRR